MRELQMVGNTLPAVMQWMARKLADIFNKVASTLNVNGILAGSSTHRSPTNSRTRMAVNFQRTSRKMKPNATHTTENHARNVLRPATRKQLHTNDEHDEHKQNVTTILAVQNPSQDTATTFGQPLRTDSPSIAELRSIRCTMQHHTSTHDLHQILRNMCGYSVTNKNNRHEHCLDGLPKRLQD